MIPDFDSMTMKELKNYAHDNGIDLDGKKKREDIIFTIKNYYGNNEEATNMDEKELNKEMENNQEVDTNVNAGTNETDGANADGSAKQEETAEEKRVWKNSKDEEVSMSQFIREKFLEDNMTRKDIAEKFKINYRTVYGATVNMTNDSEPASRGRGAVNPKIQVTADNKILTSITEGEGEAAVTKYFLNGEEIAPKEDGTIELPETVETDRNSWIKDQVAGGANRGDIAKLLDLSYGVVYGLTKEESNTRQKHEVEVEDPENPGQTKLISRSEYIRLRVAAGVSKSDVAKELGVEYSVVWQATKKDKTDAEKYTDVIESLAKMADKIDNPENSGNKEKFLAAVEALKAFTIPESKEEDETSAETAEVTEATENATAEPITEANPEA